MKHALIAASLVLVAGTTFGCGGDSDDKAAPETTSTDDFCTAYQSLFSSFETGEMPSDEEAVAAIKDWADEMEKTGTPEDIPADAEEGFQLVLDTIADIPDDATKAEIQKMTQDLSAEEQKASDAFGKWSTETCPMETPSSSPK